MKAITILQPWASLIVVGTVDQQNRLVRKDIENRTWFTHYRGRILIHAGVRKDTSQFQNAAIVCAENGWNAPGPKIQYPAGCLLGTARLAACVTQHTSPWFFGPFGFVLEDVEVFDQPIPATGMLGLWDWNP